MRLLKGSPIWKSGDSSYATAPAAQQGSPRRGHHTEFSLDKGCLLHPIPRAGPRPGEFWELGLSQESEEGTPPVNWYLVWFSLMSKKMETWEFPSWCSG